jgi:diguanylate cyclase (GGDEF)-like protein
LINFLRRSLSNPSVLLVILIASTVGGVLWVMKFTIIEQDKLFVLHSQEMVASGLKQRHEQLVGALREYSVWDAMAENVSAETLNKEWLESNMSGSAYANQSINIEAIIDRQKKINYLLLDGELVPPNTKSQTLVQLVNSLYPLAERANPYLKNATSMGYVKVNDGGTNVYYLVIMEPIVLENGTNVPSNSRFLLFASALDKKWVGALGANFRLRNPSVTDANPGVQPHVALTDAQGRLQGYLVWALDMPGHRIFIATLPYVLILLGVLVGIAVLLGRLASHLQSSQLAQAVRLAAQGEALRSLALSKDAIPSSHAYAEAAAALARTTLHLPHLSVWELSEDRQTLLCKALNEQARRLSVFGNTIERGYAPWLFDVLDRKIGLVLPQVIRNENPDYWVNIGGAGAILAMPTLVRDQAIGLVLAMNHWPRQWRPDETNFLASIADMLALSIESQARKRAEQELTQRIYFDELTALPNRAYLGQQVQDLINSLQSSGQYICALVSLEGLVLVNDKYGVATGDQLLVGVAKRLEHFCGPTELIGRVGDNRFVLILDLDRGVNLEQRLDMLFGFFSSPVKTSDISLLTRFSVGVSRLQARDAWAHVLHNAEIALHTFYKLNRENGWLEYSVEHHASEQEALALREDLQVALERDELFIVYQPIITLATGCISGAEALIRWQHPGRGLISPDVFIPLAEASGSIYSIGLWVLRQAVRQIKAWQQMTEELLTISVNVSMLQLEQRSFAEDVCRILQEENVPSVSLELEVTEGIALSSAPEVEMNLAYLRGSRIKLAIDDFGTGYASFSYLRRFEVGKLKIDRMFLEGVPDKKRSTNLVRMIIAMGHTLNAQVTGEGIETEEQATFLREAGCEFGQGFLFSRPLSVENFSKQLNEIYRVS